MNETMTLIKSRRSIRKFQDKEISKEMLDTLFQAVQWAPSWTNCQCWEVIHVIDKDLRLKIQETMIKNPATKAIVEAPVLLALCGKKNVSGFYDNHPATVYGDWLMFDLGIATQNICLAAHAMGLGTVIVGLYDHVKVKDILNVPEGYDQVVLIPVGYPAKEPSAPNRRDLTEFVHTNTFGG
ncbi:MAG: nitroreductase family protein [Proteobacteria bacterium]|nr:nitroreductase family protein [Pseudomonadota bacterium]